MEKQSNTHTSSSSLMSSSPSQSSSWVRGTCIGRGCFGTVSTAISKTNGEIFAVKSVDVATCLPTQSESLENEISVLRSLKPHPYIVRFLGDGFSKEGTMSFRNLYLEYLPEGDVANYATGAIDEALLRRYTACLVSALRHVHSQGFVHCDVKARNVLVSQSSVIKLADFGAAIKIDKPTAQITPRGSPLWMAPEVIRREYQGPESDIWSLGCTIIEIITGNPAWEDLGIHSLSRIGFSDELPLFPSMLSEIGRDFLDKCLKRDANQRWSCEQLLQHPFLSQCHNSFPTESSPRCVLDWVSAGFDLEEEEVERSEWRSDFEIAAMARISKLATTGRAIWESDGWVEVRSHSSEEEGTTMEYSGSTRVESGYNTSPDPYVDVADDSAINDVAMSPNRPQGNEGSAVALPYELVMVLVQQIKLLLPKLFSIFIVVINIIVIVRTRNWKCDLSFNLRHKVLFVCTCDSDRTKYLLRGEKRLTVLFRNCCLLLINDNSRFTATLLLPQIFAY